MRYDPIKSKRLLEINRSLIEGRGDDFAVSLAEYITAEGMPISDAALMTLLWATRSVRPSDGEKRPSFLSES